MSDWNKQVIEEFRANEGKVDSHFKNMTLLLLHTTGAKSGQPRVNPVATIKDGQSYIIIASKGGAPTNPDWYYNLVAHPQVTVEVGTEEFQAQAAFASEPQRTELFDKMAAAYPAFDEYRQKTSRQIPVISLTPLSN